MHTLIKKNISLREKNWFKTGGSAHYFAEPTDLESFKYLIEYANKNNLPILMLGDGANMLISDDGFDGLVIHPKLTLIEYSTMNEQENSVLVTAGCGVRMADLINDCLDHEIIGLEEFSGIPGTVGGSVYINLHYYEFFLAQFLDHATVINKKTYEVQTVTPDWFSFGYNVSTLIKESYYLVSATFKLKKVSPLNAMYARGRSAEIIRHRIKRYPHTYTCGSFFRNFTQEEVSLVWNRKKMIHVAYYLDKIGIKGALSVGGATVSYQHANMIVTNETATSSDIIGLARMMQERVYQEFGITPQPECRLIGFKEYPLL